jgi:hypothetical protein
MKALYGPGEQPSKKHCQGNWNKGRVGYIEQSTREPGNKQDGGSRTARALPAPALQACDRFFFHR